MKLGTLEIRPGKGADPSIRASVEYDAIAVHNGELLFVSAVGSAADMKVIQAVANSGGTIPAIWLASGLHVMRPGDAGKSYRYAQNPGRCIMSASGYNVFKHRLGFGQDHRLFVSRTPGFMLVASDEAIWQELKGEQYNTPLLREWLPYVAGELREKGLLSECQVHPYEPLAEDAPQAPLLTSCVISAAGKDVDDIVLDGLRKRLIAIAAPAARTPPMVRSPTRGRRAPKVRYLYPPLNHWNRRRCAIGLSECNTMDEYFLKYGEHHVENARRLLKPLHRPGVDPVLDFSDIAEFNPKRVPLPAQAHVITAMVKGLQAGRGGFNSADMGAGKTIMASVAAYKYLNGKGRVVVMCPDHIIDKWVETELKPTIPGARVISFENWKEVVRYYHEIGDFSRGDKRWKEPDGIEFVVLGRDQSKYLPNSPNVGEEKACFDGKRRSLGSSYRRIVGHEDVKDDDGERAWDEDKGRWKRKPIIARIYQCPACGKAVFQKRLGTPVDVSKSASGLRCTGRYAVQVLDKDSKVQGRDRLGPLDGRYDEAPAGKLIKEGGNTYVLRVCGEPLWNYVAKPRRWAPAQFIHDKLRGVFDVAIIDEIHEEKSDSSAQAIAAGKIMAASGKILALTGTLIGGYAWHLFPLLMRIKPKGLVEEGIRWGQSLEFSRRYGRVDRIIKITQEEGGGGSSRSRRSSSMRRVRNGSMREYFKIAPGVMPSLYARHLIGCSVFLSMNDLATHMPPLSEYIGCTPGAEDGHRDPNDPFWTNTCVEMAPEQAAEVERVTQACKEENDRLLQTRNMSFLAATLVTTIEYPDHPYGWYPEFPGHHSVGYWKVPKIRTEANWFGVVTPADLPQDVVYPKELKLVEICKRERAAGNQVWVYVNMTGKRDIQPRLARILEESGLRVGILRARNVKPRDRIEWIEKQGKKYDVMISHPKPVMTGLDLLSKDPGGHNYSSISFYQTGTHAFVCKQASRRAWRLIQKKRCRVYYLYYHGSMQHRAVGHMAKKYAAMSTMNGDFGTEGLVAMGCGDDASLTLCRNLSDVLDQDLMHANWKKASGSFGVEEPRELSEEEYRVAIMLGIEDEDEQKLLAEPLVEAVYGSVPEPLPDGGIDWDLVEEIQGEDPTDFLFRFTQEELDLLDL